ncbi:MAG: RluA family pseudouridine synthase [Hydrogenibacillus sp.]|nr:RluA family pseudouridine synthase [Hydrogenibacillus sp.]
MIRNASPYSPFDFTILYEDNHVLAVVKPPGLPAQSDGRAVDLLHLLKTRRKIVEHKKGEAFLGLVHRLDQPTGGVMVFAKTSKAAARLSEAFRKREAVKIYLTVTDGVPRPGRGTLRDCLKKNPADGQVAVVPCGTPGAREAVLEYAVIDARPSIHPVPALLAVRPVTGRTHQIRVQLAHHGTPIVGDRRYHQSGGRGAPDLALWAYHLTIPHPITRIPLKLCARPLPVPPWDRFDTAIAALEVEALNRFWNVQPL